MFVQYYHPLLYEPYAAFLGLTPGEDSSGGDQHRLGITKAGNRHVRMLLVEAAQNYARGQVDYKSSCLAVRQKGNAPAVIEYADKANERLRRKYYRMTLKNGKKANVAKTAVARELACFIFSFSIMWNAPQDIFSSNNYLAV